MTNATLIPALGTGYQLLEAFEDGDAYACVATPLVAFEVREGQAPNEREVLAVAVDGQVAWNGLQALELPDGSVLDSNRESTHADRAAWLASLTKEHQRWAARRPRRT